MENIKNSIENPTSAEAYVNRGDKSYNQGDYQAAISDYDEAIRLDPKYTRAYYNRGVAKNELGDSEAAISDYDEAIRINPEHAIALPQPRKRQSSNWEKAAIFDAISDYESLRTAIRNEYAIAYYNRGNSKIRLGHPEAAILIMMRRSTTTEVVLILMMHDSLPQPRRCQKRTGTP